MHAIRLDVCSTRSSQQRFHEIAHAHSWSILCLRRHFGKAGLLAHHNPVSIFTIVKLYFFFIIHRQSLRSKVYNCRVFSFTKNAYAGFRRTWWNPWCDQGVTDRVKFAEFDKQRNYAYRIVSISKTTIHICRKHESGCWLCWRRGRS